MSSQPIIIEEQYKSSIEQSKSNQDDCQNRFQQQNFFQVMDSLDEYDTKINQINEVYTEAMLVLANIKFNDPFTSLSIKGYKPTPAITKLNEQGKLIKKYEGFSKPLEQDQYEYEQQQEVEQQCRLKCQSLSQQQFILDRFNVFSHKNAVVQAAKKFKLLLTKILQLKQKRQETIQKYKLLQKKKLQKEKKFQ